MMKALLLAGCLSFIVCGGRTLAEEQKTEKISDAQKAALTFFKKLLLDNAKFQKAESDANLERLKQKPQLSESNTSGTQIIWLTKDTLGDKLGDFSVFGSISDIKKESEYICIELTLYVKGDPKDGSPSFRLVLDKTSKAVVFVYRVPGG